MSNATMNPSGVNPSASAGSTESELLIAVFSDEEIAGKALAALKQGQSAGGVKFDAAAVIRREDDGALSIKETSDVSTAAGAVAGGVLGGLLGLLTGKKVVGAGLGALLGAGAAHMLDAGIPDARLEEIAATLPNGTSALAMLMNVSQHDAATSLLAPLNGTFTSETIKVGTHVNVPKTGIEGFDSIAKQAADAAAPFAATAAASISSAQTSVEDFAKQTTDSAKETWHNVSSGASDMATKAGDAVQATASKVSDSVGNAVGSASDATKKAVDDAKEIAIDTVDSVKDATKDAAKSVEKNVNKAADAASQVADDVVQTVKDTTEAAADAASGAIPTL